MRLTIICSLLLLYQILGIFDQAGDNSWGAEARGVSAAEYRFPGMALANYNYNLGWGRRYIREHPEAASKIKRQWLLHMMS